MREEILLASGGIEDGSIHAQLLQLHLLRGTGARPRHPPASVQTRIRTEFEGGQAGRPEVQKR
jgi:hypothetical protein